MDGGKADQDEFIVNHPKSQFLQSIAQESQQALHNASYGIPTLTKSTSLLSTSPYAVVNNQSVSNKLYSKDLHILGMAKGSSIIVADPAKPSRRQATIPGATSRIESTWRNANGAPAPQQVIISQKNNLPNLHLKTRINKAQELYKKNIALYTKIQNVKSTVPTIEKLEKDYANHVALKSKLQIYEHQQQAATGLDRLTTADKNSQNEDGTIGSPEKSQDQTTHRSHSRRNEQRVVIKKRSDPLVQREKMKSNINYLERKMRPLLSNNGQV